MVSVIAVKNRKNEYVRFTCSGHAGYDEHGKDIVCAALSMLVINTVNAIDALTDCRMTVTTDETDGEIEVIFPDAASEKAELLLDAMLLGIQGVIEEYGSAYATLTMKEV
ncbi:MAG: ribosomal-processing cysteine protease Prp [Lachnospiraceae bacterium]|nr:ribosomal-processing cysteine protease Prp [Lachnospiraceae bacterium]